MVLGGSSCCIDAHADNTTQQEVTREAGAAAAGYFLGQRNDLRIVTFLADRNRDVGVALRLDDAGRDALRRNLKADNVSLRARRRRRDRDILGRSTRD